MVLETSLELCKQDRFEEQERLCIQIGSRCQDLLREIEDSPTNSRSRKPTRSPRPSRRRSSSGCWTFTRTPSHRRSSASPSNRAPPTTTSRSKCKSSSRTRWAAGRPRPWNWDRPTGGRRSVHRQRRGRQAGRVPPRRRAGRIIKVPLHVTAPPCRRRSSRCRCTPQYRTRSGAIGRRRSPACPSACTLRRI